MQRAVELTWRSSASAMPAMQKVPCEYPEALPQRLLRGRGPPRWERRLRRGLREMRKPAALARRPHNRAAEAALLCWKGPGSSPAGSQRRLGERSMRAAACWRALPGAAAGRPRRLADAAPAATPAGQPKEGEGAGARVPEAGRSRRGGGAAPRRWRCRHPRARLARARPRARPGRPDGARPPP